MKTIRFQTEALTCPSCIKKIEGALTRQAGVQEATVLFNSSKVKVVYDEAVIAAEQLQNTITGLGYEVLSSKIS